MFDPEFHARLARQAVPDADVISELRKLHPGGEAKAQLDALAKSFEGKAVPGKEEVVGKLREMLRATDEYSDAELALDNIISDTRKIDVSHVNAQRQQLMDRWKAAELQNVIPDYNNPRLGSYAPQSSRTPPAQTQEIRVTPPSPAVETASAAPHARAGTPNTDIPHTPHIPHVPHAVTKVVSKLGVIGGIVAAVPLLLSGEFAEAAASLTPFGDSALAVTKGDFKQAGISAVDEVTFGAGSALTYATSKEATWGSVSMNEINETQRDILSETSFVPEKINGRPAFEVLRDDPKMLNGYIALARQQGDNETVASLDSFRGLEEMRQYKLSLESPQPPALNGSGPKVTP